MTPRLYVFDADGTLRRTRVEGQPCPHHPDEWELLPGVRARLLALPSDALLGVASNQDHVGYGLVSRALAHRMLVDLMRTACDRTLPDEAVRFCPHTLEDGCDCRKPAPGMLRQIVAWCRLRPDQALFVGDEPRDQEAARRAGMPFAWAHEFFGW